MNEQKDRRKEEPFRTSCFGVALISHPLTLSMKVQRISVAVARRLFLPAHANRQQSLRVGKKEKKKKKEKILENFSHRPLIPHQRATSYEKYLSKMKNISQEERCQHEFFLFFLVFCSFCLGCHVAQCPAKSDKRKISNDDRPYANEVVVATAIAQANLEEKVACTRPGAENKQKKKTRKKPSVSNCCGALLSVAASVLFGNWNVGPC